MWMCNSQKRFSALPRGVLPVRRHSGRSDHTITSDIAAHIAKRPCSAIQRTTIVTRSNNSASIVTAPEPVEAVLYDMDGVLCESEHISRLAACEVMKELHNLDVSPEEFVPFTGTGEANFLGGVVNKYGRQFDVNACKSKFFEIYMSKYALPGAGIGCIGAKDLVVASREAGLKTAVASSADRVKVDANLCAADIPQSLFDTIVSADAFEKLKPSPDIFLAAAKQLGVPPSRCVVIEDAVAGVQAARAAGMRVIGVTTSLSLEAMESAAPDMIFKTIGDISLEDITLLRSTAPAPAGAAKASQLPILDGYIDLPMGYKTTRRDGLKFLSLGLALSSLGVMLTHTQVSTFGIPLRTLLLAYHIPTLVQIGIILYVFTAWGWLTKSLSYTSPQAIVNLLFPREQPPQVRTTATTVADRVKAYERYIANLEKRGGGQLLPLDFDTNATWLNTSTPLFFSRQLKGKVVVLDFWTLCCINCQHILPDLALLESRFASNSLAVVGIHSAKFDNEKSSEAVRSAVLRYDIRHPCLNDPKMIWWYALGISAWPTLLVISPQGRIITRLIGETHSQDLQDIVAAALEYYGEQGLLSSAPLPMALEKDSIDKTRSGLRFPGKIATDLTRSRLFIADSGNHRIVILDSDTGQFIGDIGGNGPGLQDGGFTTASFNRPQGLAYSAELDVLYVADTESHAVRSVDLRTKTVSTLVGNGTRQSDLVGGNRGRNQSLNSPWDVVIDSNGTLVLAMAGQHQIWRVDPSSGIAFSISGTGQEANKNGGAAVTCWAQPSGLTIVGRTLYVADSESSSIRSLDVDGLIARGCVGGDPFFSDNLFSFGDRDRDGGGGDALLQHPLAVLALSPGEVLVADSYNHKLKMLNTETGSLQTLVGTGTAGYKDGLATSGCQLSEPSGLALGKNGCIFIADTNNGLIRILDLKTRSLKTMNGLEKIPPPRISPDVLELGDPLSVPATTKTIRAQTSVSSPKGMIEVIVKLPPAHHLTQGASSPWWAETQTEDDQILLEPSSGLLREVLPGVASARLHFERRSTDSNHIRINARIYYCKQQDVCLYDEIVGVVEVTRSATFVEADEIGDSTMIKIEYTLQ